MEDIKARYYAVARQLLVGREGTEDSVANNVLVKHPFNLTHERYCSCSTSMLYIISWTSLSVHLHTTKILQARVHRVFKTTEPFL